MINGSGIWISVGDDSIGEYRTHYLGAVDTDNIRTWTELLGFLAFSIEGLVTYHEERQREQPPLLPDGEMEEWFNIERESEEYNRELHARNIESRKAQGWQFPVEPA